jgi:hypothetical protein
VRPRLARLAGAAEEFRDSVRRARGRRRFPPRAEEQASADEVKRRIDETRTRLRGEIPPRDD